MPLWSRKPRPVSGTPVRSWRDRFRSTSRPPSPSTSINSVASEPPPGYVANLSASPFVPVTSTPAPDPVLIHRLTPTHYPTIPQSSPPFSPVTATPAPDPVPVHCLTPAPYLTAEPPSVLLRRCSASAVTPLTAIPAPTPVPAAVHPLIPARGLTPEPTPGSKTDSSRDQTLWQKALDSIPSEDKVGVDFQTASLLHNLISATKEKKQEIEAKKWVYRNSHGETVSYADRFLTLLNKYVGIVDIAIQHDPHVVALVWSGFRFLLQVSIPTE